MLYQDPFECPADHREFVEKFSKRIFLQKINTFLNELLALPADRL